MKLGGIVVETPTLLTLEVENGKQYYTPLAGKVVLSTRKSGFTP